MTALQWRHNGIFVISSCWRRHKNSSKPETSITFQRNVTCWWLTPHFLCFVNLFSIKTQFDDCRHQKMCLHQHFGLLGHLNYWWRHHDVTPRHHVRCRIFWSWIIPLLNTGHLSKFEVNWMSFRWNMTISFFNPFSLIILPLSPNRWRHNTRFFPKYAKYIFFIIFSY